MLNDTTLLLDLDGVSVVRVERLADGRRRGPPAHGRRDREGLPGLRGVRDPDQGLRDDPTPRPPVRRYGAGVPLDKRCWFCREPACPRRSFTEQIPQIPAPARIITRLRAWAGHRVRDVGFTVVQAARDLHLSWPTVMDAFRTQAREVIDAPLPEVKVLGIDETRRGRPRWEQDPVTGRWHLVRDR